MMHCISAVHVIFIWSSDPSLLILSRKENVVNALSDDNGCGDLCNWGFPAKTNQNMCHSVQTIRNLVQGRGEFNVYEEIISLQNL